MFSLDFDGWFQCRLATDPDAWDDPRGQNGWTFAVPGEPDLDRIIRFQDPVAPRSHGPRIGVAVRALRVDGATIPAHAFLDAPLRLLDSPVFEGRNGEIATSANEPILPFHFKIEASGATLVGRDPIDVGDLDDLARRQPIGFQGNSPEVARATGIRDPIAYRRQRKTALQADSATETDATRMAALQKRIDELGKGSIRNTSLGFQLNYRFEIRGPNEWIDPNRLLGPPPSAATPWVIAFWMGAWDADALSAYVSGTISVG